MFKVTCPFCNKSATYSRERDVKPILDSDEKILISKKQIDELVEKAIKSTGDAKILANELKGIPINPQDDIETQEDNTLPPDHNHPASQSEKKKDPHFYG